MTRLEELSRRERQVMDVVYELEEASAKDIQGKLPDAPSYSAVRAVLARLVEMGELRYRESGPRYLYRPVEPKKKARQGILKRTVDTFFEGSPARMMHALLDESDTRLTRDELDQLARTIEAARERKP